MTSNFTYYPDPGIAYDISKMLLVKLNPQSIWTDLFTTPANIKKDMKHIQYCADALSSPKSELLIFSFIPSNQKTTFLTYVISNLLNSGTQNFSISQLCSYLYNYTLIKNELLNFYFDSPNINNLDLDYAIRNNRTLPDKLKILLLTFLMNPEKYLSSLISVINSYYAEIKENLSPPISKDTNLSKFFHLLTARYMSKIETSNNPPMFTEIAYSLSYCVPDFLIGEFYANPPYFISTEMTINDFIQAQEEPLTFLQLIDSCHAMGDKTRISILNLLLVHTNITINEISEKIGLTITATKYHLTLLKKADLLSTSRVHRKIAYSFNPDGFKKIKNLLDLMEKGDLQ